MGSPRFRPAQIFANPRHFGRVKRAVPISTSSLSDSDRAWVALALREELVHRCLTVADLATQLGSDLAWLTRKLNGQAPTDLGEILGWALLLGPQILPPLDSVRDLLPSPERDIAR
jgi:hypothetical protein